MVQWSLSMVTELRWTFRIAWTVMESGMEVPWTHAKWTRTFRFRKQVCVNNLHESVELPYHVLWTSMQHAVFKHNWNQRTWGAELLPPFSYPHMSHRQWRNQQLASYSSSFFSAKKWPGWLAVSGLSASFLSYLFGTVELSSFTSYPFHYPATSSYFTR